MKRIRTLHLHVNSNMEQGYVKVTRKAASLKAAERANLALRLQLVVF